MFLSSFNVVLSWSMVACGTSGLLGGLRVFAPFALPVDDNSLIPAVPVFAVVFRAVAFFVTGFLVAALARDLLVAVFFGLAMIFSPCHWFYFSLSKKVCYFYGVMHLA
jgi:hypothetical protein